MRTDRVILYDTHGSPLGDLDPTEVSSRVRHEELNGEHSMEIVTTRRLEVGWRMLTVDATGKWREHVVNEIDEEHATGRSAIGTYRACQSMQYDLMGTPGGEKWAAAEEGTNDPISATQALAIALGESRLWRPGTCDVGGTAGASLFDNSCWNYLSTLQEAWGGEFEARIEVDSTGVISRYVDWRVHVGSQDVTRRFDWSRDMTSITRTTDEGPYYCRVIPRGGSEATDADGVKYSNRIGIETWTKTDVRYRVVEVPPVRPSSVSTIDGLLEGGFMVEPTTAAATRALSRSVNVGDVVADPVGVPWILDTESAYAFRTRMPDGRWFFPTKVVNYSLKTAGDDQELYEKALDELHSHTRPTVTYEASVLQLASAGMDAKGVELGDDVHIVDRGFSEQGLRMQGRVVGIESDEMSDGNVTLTIGTLHRTLADEFRAITNSVEQMLYRLGFIDGGSTAKYLELLVDRLNEEINATDGYCYIVPGEGIITYDKRVADPLIGIEAEQVVQVKGGSIRIANTKKAAFSGIGDWNWKTVIVSGHVAAELVTAANIVTGYIGNASQGSYWNLDTNEFQIATNTKIGRSGPTVETVAQNASTALLDASDARKVATDYLTYRSGTGLDIGYSETNAKTRINATGMEVFDNNGASEAVFNGTMARMGRSDKAHVTVTPNTGIEMFDSSNVSVLFAGLSNNTAVVRVGRASGSGNVVMSSEGSVDIRRASTVLAHFGYGEGVDWDGGTSVAPYYDIGVRKSGLPVGNYSVAEGTDTTSAGWCSHAEGQETTASGAASHAEGYGTMASGAASHAEGRETSATFSSHAEGRRTSANDESHAEGYGTTANGRGAHAEGCNTTASRTYSHAEGYGTTASGECSHAEGYKCSAEGYASHAGGESSKATGPCSFAFGYNSSADTYNGGFGANKYSVAFGTGVSASGNQLVIGRYNQAESNHEFVIGGGRSDSDRSNTFTIMNGWVWASNGYNSGSDRRLKRHQAYLGDDACDFVRKLKPVLYEKGGARQTGFYAQDVQAAEPDGWNTSTVTEQHMSDSLGFNPLALDYSALIAPLTAYAQALERRIDEQQATIEEQRQRMESLAARLDALEARC